MKKCARCKKEYDDSLESCPYCDKEPANLIAHDLLKNPKPSMTEDTKHNTMPDDNLEPRSKVFCKHCGTEIIDNNDYCKHCGRNIYDERKKHCTNCGKVLEESQTFCDKCGQKRVAIVLPKAVSDAKNKFSKKKMIIAIMASVVLVAMIITGVKLVPKLFVKYDTYMAEGNYEKAYDKAKDDEKELVIKENIAAIVSELTKETLKDSSSFVLREVYVEENMKNVVLKEQGNNSYGGAVSGYVWYRWNDENAEFESWGSCSDFEKEEYNSWDDTDDTIEKLAKNIVISYVQDVVSRKETKMDSVVVDRINELNKNGKLKDINLLEPAKTILSKSDDTAES